MGDVSVFWKTVAAIRERRGRYTLEAFEKSVAELEQIETHLGYIDDKVTAVSNEYLPSRNYDQP